MPSQMWLELCLLETPMLAIESTCRSSRWVAPRDEYELQARPVRRVTHLIEPITVRIEGLSDLVAFPEPQRRIRRDHGAIGFEDEHRPDGHGRRARANLARTR